MIEKYIAEIDNIINEALQTSEKSGVYWQSLIRRLNNTVLNIEMIFASGIDGDVQAAYKQSVSESLYRLRSLKSLPKSIKKNISYQGIIKADRTRNTINGIVDNAMSDFNISLENNIRRITNYFNQLQRQNILAYQGDIEPTQQTIRKSIRENLKELSTDKKYIKIIDKNGKERNYNISKYAKMVTEYKMTEARSQASINIAQTLGSDLVQMDFHNSRCEICGPKEGKVYSISGKDGRFPKLTFEVPLHPNCYHVLVPIFAEVLEIRGIDNYIKFSNGNMPEKDIIKMFPSYTPLNQRTISV